MAEIIRHLNEKKIKTSRDNEFNKNSIRKILTNKRYIGIYIYKDIEIKDGIPRIISDELYKKVQIMMSKNKTAPARSKAKVEYILTTKLFCGFCDSMMVGVSGTSRNGSTYNYYSCNMSRKKQCEKRTVSKDYLEDLVVKETKKILTDKNIDRIAKEVVALCEKEKNNENVGRLRKLLKENEKATDNLMKALEQGQIADIVADRIAQKKAEREELQKQIIQEENQYPVLTIPQVKFFMGRFKSGNVNDMKYRKALVDTFIRKITLYEDKMTILYNTQDGQSSVPLNEECSYKGTMVEHSGFEPLASTMRT